MNIFRKYFLKEFLKYFSLILLTLTAIAVISEFFDKSPEFYAHKPPVFLIIQYLLLQSPKVILYVLPFASLFSILITIGIASKWRETTVIKASGCSTKKMFSMFIILGLLISLVSLVLGETIVPAATRHAEWVRKALILKEPPRITQREEALWLKGLDGSLIRISGFVEDQNRVLKTSIFTFNSSFRMEKRIEADEAEWENGRWNLKNVTVYDFMNNSTEKFSSYVTTSIEEPRIFRQEMRKPQEMNFMELHAYYSRLEKSGFKNLKYLVRLYEKLAYPAINFVMMLFGIALALNERWGGGIKAAGLGILVTVIYWLLYSTSTSLGIAGTLPPWLAPWVSPAVFGIAGTVLYLQIKE